MAEKNKRPEWKRPVSKHSSAIKQIAIDRHFGTPIYLDDDVNYYAPGALGAFAQDLTDSTDPGEILINKSLVRQSYRGEDAELIPPISEVMKHELAHVLQSRLPQGQNLRPPVEFEDANVNPFRDPTRSTLEDKFGTYSKEIPAYLLSSDNLAMLLKTKEAQTLKGRTRLKQQILQKLSSPGFEGFEKYRKIWE